MLDNNESSTVPRTIHLGVALTHGAYLLFIFVSIIICLIVAKVGQKTDVVNYIGFAATISSLILAILAIYIGLSGNSVVSRFMFQAEELTRHFGAART